ncbi:MAG TPA: Kiwa anti-phage protein KwaB-like domain-containing protein [Clostridia bacterium]|nr:Kiwa anti-phage protein KwaB-like domain-containing protein [Clostridia bacterium]
MRAKQTLTIDPAKRKEQESKNLLRQIKESDRKTAPVTLWLGYRYPSPKADPNDGNGPVLYHRVRRLDVDEKLSAKLREIVNKAIDRAKRLEEYTFEGAVEAESALYEEVTATDFQTVLKLIVEAGEEDVVQKELHLNRAYAYIIELQPEGAAPIYAFRKLSRTWKARELHGLINALLRDKILVTIDEENVFRFDQRIDFFSSGNYVFIMEKANFESALHFRAGMERKRDSLLLDLEGTNLYSGLEILQKLSTSHVRWLKKLAGAFGHGKCSDPRWIGKMLKCCDEHGWDITKVDGKVLITENNCERILRLMNYDLLESPVDELLFNVDGAKSQTN